MIADKEIYDKFSNHFGEGYNLALIKPCLYPLYKIQLQCSYKQKSAMPAQIVILLRFISAGMKFPEDIRKLMGIDKRIFDKLLAEIHIKDYIVRVQFKDSEIIQLSERGEKILENNYIDSYETDSKILILDGIIDKFIDQPNSINPKKEKNDNSIKKIDKLKPAIKHPHKLSWEKDYYRRFFDFIRSQDNNNRTLYEINDIEKSYKIHEVIYVLVFRSQDDEDKIMIID